MEKEDKGILTLSNPIFELISYQEMRKGEVELTYPKLQSMNLNPGILTPEFTV